MAASWFSPRSPSSRKGPLSPKPRSNQRRISEPIVSPSQLRTPASPRRKTLLSRWKSPSDLSTPMPLRPSLPVSPRPTPSSPTVNSQYLNNSPTTTPSSRRIPRDVARSPPLRPPIAVSRRAPLPSSSNISCSSTDAVDLSSLKPRPAMRTRRTPRKSGSPSLSSNDSSSFSDGSSFDSLKPRPATRRTKKKSAKGTLLSPGKLTSPTQCLSSESSSQSSQDISSLKPRPATKRTKRKNKNNNKNSIRYEQANRAASASVTLTKPKVNDDTIRRHSDGAALPQKGDKSSCTHMQERRSQTQQREEIEIGNVIPCDAAFLDCLDEQGGHRCFNFQEVYLYSDQERRFCKKYNTFHITYYHTMRYKGEIVWRLTTTCHGNSQGIYGESSSCNLSEISVRVRIRQKVGDQRRIIQKHQAKLNSNDSKDHTTSKGPLVLSNKKHVISLENILLNSAELYRSKHNSSSFASSSPTSKGQRNSTTALATTMAGQIINLPF